MSVVNVCTKCKCPAKESTRQYSIRTRYSLSAPFVCLFCIRINKPEKVLVNDNLNLHHLKRMNKGRLSAPYLMRKLKVSSKEADALINGMDI